MLGDIESGDNRVDDPFHLESNPTDPSSFDGAVVIPSLLFDLPENTDEQPRDARWYEIAAYYILSIFQYTIVYPLFFAQQQLVDGYDSGEVIQMLSDAIYHLTQAQNEMSSENSGQSLDEEPMYFFYGLLIAGLSSMLMTLVVIHYSKKDHHHHHHHEHHSRARQLLHSVGHELGHYATIGITFGTIASAACADIIWKLDPDADLALVIPMSSLAGLLAMWGNVKIHGFHADEASHGQGVLGFFKTLLRTFVLDLKGFNNFWKKYGILIGHGCEGYFAALLASEVFGLEDYPWIDIPLKILLPLLITMFEGLTEASCIDQQQDHPSQIPWQSAFTTDQKRAFISAFITKGPIEAIKVLSSILHALPTVIGGSELLEMFWKWVFGNYLGEDVIGITINEGFIDLLSLSISTVVLLYPNASGFKSLINEPVDETASALGKIIKNSFASLCGNTSTDTVESGANDSKAASLCFFSSIFRCANIRNSEAQASRSRTPSNQYQSLPSGVVDDHGRNLNDGSVVSVVTL